MASFEAVLEVGGPVLLEELEPNKRMIEAKELSETLIDKYPGTTFVEAPRRCGVAEGQILPHSTSRNTTLYPLAIYQE